MNLKEAFRYQNFLDGLMNSSVSSITQREHCLSTTKHHLCNKVNPDAEDFTEDVVTDEFVPNDVIIGFMMYLIDEKELLTKAINNAKKSIDFDIDAAVEKNKFRQNVYRSLKSMMRYTSSKRIEFAYGYKFNVEGNQTQYRYDVCVETKDAYDKKEAKNIMRKVISDSDITSADIDAAKINTMVEYEPPFDVNESFEDVIDIFIRSRAEKDN